MAAATTLRSADGRLHLAQLPIALERDVFLRDLLRHLSGTLEEVVGVREAAGFVRASSASASATSSTPRTAPRSGRIA